MTNGPDRLTTPAAVLDRLGRDISTALGESLVGVYVFGSWVAGDFDPQRSDLDLLAVLESDPTQVLADELSRLHRTLVADAPGWNDRIEVEYVSVAGLSDFRDQPHVMVRISPGEPIHLVSATRHHLLNWYSARYEGAVLLGPPAGEVLPDFTEADFRAAVLEHAAHWPEWVQDHRTPVSQAYAVLTVCRALCSVSEVGQTTKRRAAAYGATRLPQWAELINWSERLWYDRHEVLQFDRHRETTRFVQEVVEIIAALADCQASLAEQP